MSEKNPVSGTKKSFDGQHDGEEVKLVFNQHPLVMRGALIIGLLAILFGVLPLLFWPLSDIAMRIALITPLFVLAYWFYHWVGWYYSVYVVTDERIVEITQRGFFNRRVRELRHDKVQNINYHINGFQAVLFQFGDIRVKTFTDNMVMATIHKPVTIHEKLLQIVRDSGGAQASSTPPEI